MSVAEEPNPANLTISTMIDEAYEFSAPRFFDFVKGESDEDKRKAELWFDTALTHAPSPFMPRIKTGRSFTMESLCDFSVADQMQKETSSSSSDLKINGTSETMPETVLSPVELKEEVISSETKEEIVIVNSADKGSKEDGKGESKSTEKHDRASATILSSSSDVKNEANSDKENSKPSVQAEKEACTPVPPNPGTNSKKHQTAKKIASLVRNPSALKPKSQIKSSQSKTPKPSCLKSETNVKSTAGTLTLAQENQAIKRQKLEGGQSRQILSLKPHNLPHKTKSGLVSGSSNFCPSTVNRAKKDERKIYVREGAAPAQAPPFVSAAEMMKKFQSSTRDLSLPHTGSQMKPRLTLTRPKEPEFETAQRARSVKIKSTAELEEEMMAKIPKFKARPLNKKILEAPSLPAVPRSTPQLPEFKEFHLETSARANHNAESASVVSTDSSRQKNQWKGHLTEPKTPLLQTSLRARPPRVKSSLEIEQEELEKLPKFKAKPLNKKIFESKGELGMFCNVKKHITIPQEFHFATDERIPPPSTVADLFDKLSLNMEPRHNPLPKNTTPNPFHLHTEERGAEKERKFIMEVVHKQWEEERARVPKANPYPYTTDYPVIPPKPEPKNCTKPNPFQLESLVRHEEEMQREKEERERKEREEAQMRVFKAQPILKEDPIPVPEKVRKPLTEVQGFSLHVDHRAVDRAEFDQKIKEKEVMYKRYREESDAARMIEEEKALKQLRRTMVPHARPVPNFNNPFCPQKSVREATKAKSPNLRVLQRKEKRRMIVNSATSSAASNMR
ncbi:protein TPX2 isoform X2 [Humulus lupulus]|uniref:protein TPX2 isoform X2 n=1 Tax=Humulus lupulus TaxID=3486 RepID=UPI002B40E6A1|nr:protein TPX2 isoform X2 [Humulus lupulus]